MLSATLAETLDSARLAHQQGRHEDALTICQAILERQADHIGTLLLTAEIAAGMGKSDRAMRIYQQVLDLNPDHATAHYKRGNLFKEQQQWEAALASYDNAIALDPGYAYAFCNRGFVLQHLKRWDAALESYDRAIALTPEDALAHYNRAAVLREIGRQEEALESYSQAIAFKADYFEAYCNCGLLLTKMKRFDEALASHTKCIEINPGFAPAHYGRGDVLQLKKEWDPALASYDRAIAIDPGYAVAHRNRGNLLMELTQWNSARSSMERAIALKPDFAEAYDCLGVLLTATGHLEEALTNFDKAIALKPDHAEAYVNRANALIRTRRFLLAIADYDRAVALATDLHFVPGMRFYAKMNICDWSDLSANLQRLVSGLETSQMLSPPMPVLTLVDSAGLQYKASQMWVQEKYPASDERPFLSGRPRPDKVKIGYFSGDFHEHPVALLTAGLFESHDRSNFEVYAFSYGPDSQGGLRKRLEAAFDQFIDVREKSDREVALLAREMGIDIAVDLGGHTGISRTGIFAIRAAPLQINYLGFPGTMGADYMDYLIADTTVIPAANQQHYAEKILYLPSFQANDSMRRISDRIFTRQDLGLPPTGCVFCCFNATYKITPATFAAWMRILAKVPDSVLYLYADNEMAVKNLKKEAQGLGVDARRLFFAEKLPLPEYLARYRVADLFLDTLPYNAGATASDALWAGLPVLTCMGEAFAARMGGSLLTAIELPELITYTQSQYEELAIALATDPKRLAAIKGKLAANRLTTMLFDTCRFAKYVETGYSKILERYHAGLAPDHVHVPA